MRPSGQDRTPVPVPGEPPARALLDALPARACVVDPEGLIVAVNAEWDRALAENDGVRWLSGPGVSYLDVCRRAADRGSPGAAPALAGLLDVLAGRRDSYSQEYTCRGPGGRARWFLMLATPLRCESGGALVSHVDITDRKLGELALRESEDRLRAVVDTAADAIITIDGRGRIDTFNAAAERMFGFDRAEVVGRDVALIIPLPDREAHIGHPDADPDAPDADPDAPGRLVGAVRQLAGRRKDGSTFPVELSVGRVASLDLFTGIIRDVSERRAMQEQLLSIAEQEQRRIGQDLHDDVGQELTGLALMIESLAEALEEDSSPERVLAGRVRAGLRRVQRRLRDLCRGLLPVEVDAEGLMAALEDLCSNFSAGQAISCRFECHSPVAIEDNRTATHLYRIAQEAVSNAARHGRPRSIVVRLEGSDEAIALTVRDDGVGIPGHAEGGPGTGLRLMRHRAGLIGAGLRIGPDEGGGTRIDCILDRKDDHAERHLPGRLP
ncbi:PAS domain-containing sensor histidine kinase [Tautonia plasticadhaerens]|uniref:histidine kinase n=1 Tax=Tautonia plasticadhaerens TaxID=2527974 RepID=A0A518H307_9BACT|nr:PAS domain S-box protein [Tautonia plasticadhaerens]QDV35223.1 Sensor protein FixL [Tautonia plasticadhaerens]